MACVPIRQGGVLREFMKGRRCARPGGRPGLSQARLCTASDLRFTGVALPCRLFPGRCDFLVVLAAYALPAYVHTNVFWPGPFDGLSGAQWYCAVAGMGKGCVMTSVGHGHHRTRVGRARRPDAVSGLTGGSTLTVQLQRRKGSASCSGESSAYVVVSHTSTRKG